MTSEKNLQDYLLRKCKFNGVYARKMQAVGHVGFPDVLLAIYGDAYFVELKSPTGLGRLSVKQARELERMSEAGLNIIVIDSKEQVDDLIVSIVDA
jgi:hypothetical protein